MFGFLLERHPEHKPPNFDRWANTVRMMRKRDNRTDEQIRELWQTVQADSFWQNNVESPSKLRDKWDRLWMQLMTVKPKFTPVVKAARKNVATR
jgi:hypothetical protein